MVVTIMTGASTGPEPKFGNRCKRQRSLSETTLSDPDWLEKSQWQTAGSAGRRFDMPGRWQKAMGRTARFAPLPGPCRQGTALMHTPQLAAKMFSAVLLSPTESRRNERLQPIAKPQRWVSLLLFCTSFCQKSQVPMLVPPLHCRHMSSF